MKSVEDESFATIEEIQIGVREMAKAKEVIGLDCAADAIEWAAEVLRVRLEEVVDLRGGALDFSDIEGVHAMRVATRRLRSALRDFAPLMKKRPLKKVRRNLKQIADALGAVRDLDVAILALEKLQEEAESEKIKIGIETELNARRALRDRARMDLMEALAISNVTGLQEEFAAAIAEATRKRKHAISFNEAGRAAVGDALAEFCRLGAALYEPHNTEALHELRIVAKRLRYAIELFVACWGERIAPFADEIADMQGFLGEVHDCDVWIESLSERLINETNDGAATAAGNRQTDIWLLSEFVKKRTKNYRSALSLWNDWETTDFTDRMRVSVAANS
jgi:CHAD domain-containing protein